MSDFPDDEYCVVKECKRDDFAEHPREVVIYGMICTVWFCDNHNEAYKREAARRREQAEARTRRNG